jgi:hypothetical protein
MSQTTADICKIPTESTQPTPGKAAKLSGQAKKAPGTARSQVLPSGSGHVATRGGGDVAGTRRYARGERSSGAAG